MTRGGERGKKKDGLKKRGSTSASLLFLVALGEKMHLEKSPEEPAKDWVKRSSWEERGKNSWSEKRSG